MPDIMHRPITSPLLRTPPGPWSNAIEVRPGARYLFTCGLVGVRQDGTMEDGIAAQAVRIFENINILLREADMDMSHVVKIISYLVDVAEQPAYAKARAPYLGNARPAMTLLSVAQLAHPTLRLEVEVIAAKHD
ncbi:Rid family hydrolase [Bradyrhizobium sp. NP1]|uniref:RidA family protein n=1 Tax=Bradyrhizobium sp. NP1 TaxID=3049772 RepID=UPI0025A4EB56|nr:Rid family hydrolase [Bradyrhizobium sp. NP1]WJR76609.1 Rid family hydrolase [Bradyrhizobium sp. NP1]